SACRRGRTASIIRSACPKLSQGNGAGSGAEAIVRTLASVSSSRRSGRVVKSKSSIEGSCNTVSPVDGSRIILRSLVIFYPFRFEALPPTGGTFGENIVEGPPGLVRLALDPGERGFGQR